MTESDHLGHVVIGASGFGREALDALSLDPAAGPACLGVADDAPTPTTLARLADRGVPYLGTVRELISRGVHQYTVAIGDPAIRARVVDLVETAGWTPRTIVHPSALLGSQTTVAAGSVICAGAVVSTNVSLGRHTHINPGAIVGHDSRLEEFTSINPGAVISGDVTIGSGTLVGAAATILQGLSICGATVIGAAACVTKDVARPGVLVGIPARHVESRGQ